MMILHMYIPQDFERIAVKLPRLHYLVLELCLNLSVKAGCIFMPV